MYYDEKPAIDYRQHMQNIIGSNISMAARVLRIKKLMEGKFKNWNQSNIDLLLNFKSELTAENQIKFDNFVQLRSSGILSRIKMLMRLKPYRQTTFGNIALVIAVILKKL